MNAYQTIFLMDSFFICVIINKLNMRKKHTLRNIIFALIGITCVIAINIYLRSDQQPGKLDDFAKCLKNSGAKLYGASWCPHCQNQKALFEKSAKYLPYVECAMPGGQGVNSMCRQAKIEAYPTWVFADSNSESGELSLEELSEKTACQLPE